MFLKSIILHVQQTAKIEGNTFWVLQACYHWIILFRQSRKDIWKDLCDLLIFELSVSVELILQQKVTVHIFKVCKHCRYQTSVLAVFIPYRNECSAVLCLIQIQQSVTIGVQNLISAVLSLRRKRSSSFSGTPSSSYLRLDTYVRSHIYV